MKVIRNGFDRGRSARNPVKAKHMITRVSSFPGGRQPAHVGITRRMAAKLMMLAPLALVNGRAHCADDIHPFHDIPKGMWVWGLDTVSYDTLRVFAQSHKIETVLLSLSAPVRARLLNEDDTLLSKLRDFRDGPIQLVALTGDPSWAERAGRMPRSLNELLQIQARHHLFDGLHLDIEPHALLAWREKDRRAGLLQGLIEFFDFIYKSALDLPLDAALPPQYADVVLEGGENALQSLTRRLSMVSLMAYRDTAHEVVEWAAPALRVLQKTGVPWRMGVLVHPTAERGTSYVGTPSDLFLADMARLDEMLRNSSATATYRGLVFEDYDGLKELLGS